MTRVAERLTPAVAYHGEGPIWDPHQNRLLTLDVFAGRILDHRDGGLAAVHDLPVNVLTAFRLRSAGGFVLAAGREILCCDPEFESMESVAKLPLGPDLRTNDGGCDSGGGFVIGVLAVDKRPCAGTVYRVAPDGTIDVRLRSVTISNGVQWSADGRRVFYIDTPTRRVDVFDVDVIDGSWRNRRTHITLDNEVPGWPDGMTIDADGGLWVALWAGGHIAHFDPDGALVELVRVPGVSQPSACAFGGADLRTLFITSSAEDLAPGAEPDAGALFGIETESRGLLLPSFAG